MHDSIISYAQGRIQIWAEVRKYGWNGRYTDMQITLEQWFEELTQEKTVPKGNYAGTQPSWNPGLTSRQLILTILQSDPT